MRTRFADTRSLNLVTLVLVSIGVCLGIAVAKESSGGRPSLDDAILEAGVVAGDPVWQASPAERYGLGDERDERGMAGPNGVPDFLDDQAGPRGHLQAVFVYDDLSAGRHPDRSGLLGEGTAGLRAVPAEDDLVNAQAFTTHDLSGGLLLYAAVERLDPRGKTRLVLEFNQRRFRISESGRLEGTREVGDLRIGVAFSPGLDHGEIERWQPLPGSAIAGWVRLGRVLAPGCALGTAACLFVNATAVPGGAWPSFDASGSRVFDLAPGALFEALVHLDRLGEPGLAAPRFASLTVTTPADLALAGFNALVRQD